MSKRKFIVSMIILASISVTGCGKTAIGNQINETNIENNISKEDNAKKEVKIPKRYQKIVNMLENIHDLKLPYFGGYSMNDKQIVVFSHEDKKAIVWNFDGKNGTKVINYSDIEEEYKSSSFAKGLFNNKNAIFVEFTNPQETFVLGIHEGYHFYGQEWINNLVKKSRPRGTYYPENIEAQYLNLDMYQRLLEHINTGDKNKLAQSIGLFKKLLNNHNNDVESDLEMNLAESSANFIEKMYLAVAKNPEKKSNLKEIGKIAYEIESDYLGLNDNNVENKAEIESQKFDKSFGYYHINSLPYFYLAMNGQSEKIETINDLRFPYLLLEQILDKKQNINSKEDYKLKKEVENYYNQKNREMKPIVEEFTNVFSSKNHAKIIVKDSLFPGSMQFGEFINFKYEKNYYTINTHTIAKSVKSKGVEFNDINTLTNENGNFVIYINKNLINLENKALKIETDNLNIDTKSYEKTENGYLIK